VLFIFKAKETEANFAVDFCQKAEAKIAAKQRNFFASFNNWTTRNVQPFKTQMHYFKKCKH